MLVGLAKKADTPKSFSYEKVTGTAQTLAILVLALRLVVLVVLLLATTTPAVSPKADVAFIKQFSIQFKYAEQF